MADDPKLLVKKAGEAVRKRFQGERKLQAIPPAKVSSGVPRMHAVPPAKPNAKHTYVPMLRRGGKIRKGGLAVLHKGERVVPKKRGRNRRGGRRR